MCTHADYFVIDQLFPNLSLTDTQLRIFQASTLIDSSTVTIVFSRLAAA